MSLLGASENSRSWQGPDVQACGKPTHQALLVATTVVVRWVRQTIAWLASLCTNLRRLSKALGMYRRQRITRLQVHLAPSILRHNTNHRIRTPINGAAQLCSQAILGGHQAHSCQRPSSSTTATLLRLCSNRCSTSTPSHNLVLGVAMVDLPGLTLWMKKTQYRPIPVLETLVCGDGLAEFLSPQQQPPPTAAPISDPPVVDTTNRSESDFALPSGSYRLRSIPPFEFDNQGQRRPSMQEAADAMLWETFRRPGPNDQVMLPPQSSRNVSLDGRKVSFGPPLQPIDSNEILPYKGKGKGRARDFEPAQAFNAWEEANMGGAGSFDAPGPGHDFEPAQVPLDPSGLFTFVPGQLGLGQTMAPTQEQSQIQLPNINIRSQESQFLQGQTIPYAGPQTAENVHPGQVITPLWSAGAQLPLQEAFQPPPGFPQQPFNPGQTFYPGSELQLPQLDGAQSAGMQSLPEVEIPMRTGYHFLLGQGFVCHVCSACVPQPGIHRFEGHNRWCWADGPGMRRDDDEQSHRWPKRAKLELYVP